MESTLETPRRVAPRTACLGLLNQKLRWGLSARGWLFSIFGGVALAAILVLSVGPFLALNDSLDSETLVVEGWVRKYAIRRAVEEFQGGKYRQVLTTGGPVTGNGGYVNDFQTSASVGADRLIKDGIPKDRVQMVPSRVFARNRTYSEAVALREWLRSNQPEIKSINVLTEDFHARRTRMLYRRALGSDIAVGVISVPSPDYNGRYWWRYSEGVQTVIGETIAYLYARLLFRP